MARFVELAPRRGGGHLSLGQVDEVVAVLRHDGLAVLPTETGYMLAARACSDGATAKVRAAKGRTADKAMHVACSTPAMIASVAEPSTGAWRAIAAWMPGPVSVVVPAADGLSPDVVLDGTVGIRMPDAAATLQVVSALGEPVTATSLNRSGAGDQGLGEPLVLSDAMSWPDEPVAVVRDDDVRVYDQPSTLVRILDRDVEELRSGPVPISAISDSVSRPSYREISDRT
ncbi:MAG TPA: L-threonylcarbamoyladenylate synthase [Acidimicrobiales bacterium]|jgi:L-threonylcarbamoyladenylate synthase